MNIFLKVTDPAVVLQGSVSDPEPEPEPEPEPVLTRATEGGVGPRTSRTLVLLSPTSIFSLLSIGTTTVKPEPSLQRAEVRLPWRRENSGDVTSADGRGLRRDPGYLASRKILINRFTVRN